MADLDQILACFPTITDWREVYLDDSRQRILGESAAHSVEIILGTSLDHVGIFSQEGETPEMLAVMELFLGSRENALVIMERARNFLARAPEDPFHAILANHTLTILRSGTETHFRISPGLDA